MSPVKRTDAHNIDIQFVRFLIMFKHRRPVKIHNPVLPRAPLLTFPICMDAVHVVTGIGRMWPAVREFS